MVIHMQKKTCPCTCVLTAGAVVTLLFCFSAVYWFMKQTLVQNKNDSSLDIAVLWSSMCLLSVVRTPQRINQYYLFLTILLCARRELLVRLEMEYVPTSFFSPKVSLEELSELFSSLNLGKFLPLLTKVGSTSQQFTSKSINFLVEIYFKSGACPIIQYILCNTQFDKQSIK